MRISLTRGYMTTVDDADVPLITNYSWWALVSRSGPVYACAYVRGSGRRRTKKVLMHRLLLGASEGQEIDHVDGDGLNNRRINLRFCTRAQNVTNNDVRRDSTSGFKGVERTPRGRYHAYIKKDGHKRHLGAFATPIEAAAAYNRAADGLYGPFARGNRIE